MPVWIVWKAKATPSRSALRLVAAGVSFLENSIDMTSVEVASSTIESSAVVNADDTKKETHTLLGGHHEVNMLIRKFISGRVRHAFLAKRSSKSWPS